MTDEIDQLLRSLHLGKIAAIIGDELAHAKKHQLAYDTFLRGSCAPNTSTVRKPRWRGASNRRSCRSSGRSNRFPSSDNPASTRNRCGASPSSNLSSRPKTSC